MVGTAQCREAGEGTQGSFVVWVCFGRGRGCMCECVCVCEGTRVCEGVTPVCVGLSHACAGPGTLPPVAWHRSTQYMWTESPTPQQHQNTALQPPKYVCYLRCFGVLWLVVLGWLSDACFLPDLPHTRTNTFIKKTHAIKMTGNSGRVFFPPQWMQIFRLKSGAFKGHLGTRKYKKIKQTP